MQHSITVKVYYEDTDCLGIVYYANYLKYLERGRTEYIDATGTKPIAEWNREGINFAVYRVTITYKKPARLGDQCTVRTEYGGGTQYRKALQQTILRGAEILTEAKVELVCLDEDLKLREFPEGLFPEQE